MAYRYPTEKDKQFANYVFESIGPNGRFLQVVAFIPFKLYNTSEKPDYYMLGFGVPVGNKLSSDFEINDKVLLNNSDTIKILNTVAFCILDFLDQNPNEVIYFEGSTLKRMQLYLSLIRRKWELIKDKFELFGDLGESWEVFEINKSKNYIGVYFQKKRNLVI